MVRIGLEMRKSFGERDEYQRMPPTAGPTALARAATDWPRPLTLPRCESSTELLSMIIEAVKAVHAADGGKERGLFTARRNIKMMVAVTMIMYSPVMFLKTVISAKKKNTRSVCTWYAGTSDKM